MISRKTATRLLLVNWSRFQNVSIRLDGSTLFTGVNGSGKSTILDAMTHLIAGNTQFNKAAKDKDRTVLAYVRGDTKANGSERYLRKNEIISYIAMEFFSPIEKEYIVIGVCIESMNETEHKSSWFICKNIKLEEMKFVEIKEKFITTIPKLDLYVKGKRLKSSDFLSKERGVDQVLRVLGLRCDANKYRSKLQKMMAFNPENNIDKFIQDCVLDPGKVESLAELREQKSKFQEMKNMFEELGQCNINLEEIEDISIEYEKKLRNFNIRKLMLPYQGICKTKEEILESEKSIEINSNKLMRLEKKKVELDNYLKISETRLRNAEIAVAKNDLSNAISHKNMELELLNEKIEKHEKELADVIKLQNKIEDILEAVGDKVILNSNEEMCLTNLSSTSISYDTKITKFRNWISKMKIFEDEVSKEIYKYTEFVEKLNIELVSLEEKIKGLEANKITFPEKIERAKKIIQLEFKKRGIDTTVRTLAELVKDIKDNEWRAAVETFLGVKRHYLIINGKYCKDALEIVDKKRLYGVNVIVSDKLPDTKVIRGSAAELLDIPNIYARRYANYLLNGIKLCDTLDELHENPKGGLMKNGMLAKSYSVSFMKMKDTEYCLGSEAIMIQLEKTKELRCSKRIELDRLEKEGFTLKRNKKLITSVDWNIEWYNFDSKCNVEEAKIKKIEIQGDIDRFEKNPDLLAILDEKEKAEIEYRNIMDDRDKAIHMQGEVKNSIKNSKSKIYEVKQEKNKFELEYKELCLKYLDLNRVMIQEYEWLTKDKGTNVVISASGIAKLGKEINDVIKNLENKQLDYCRLAQIDSSKRGVRFIPFYRAEYKNTSNVKIEEASISLERQSKKLEDAFMNDFVAEINETIRNAKFEINSINRELNAIPFGTDTYRFIMREKSERSIFFRICRKLEKYMESPQRYMDSSRDDDEMEHDMQEFMNLILEEEDELEYTDYRKYFTYDMEIISRQGSEESTSDLSKKQGSASNGEKQTPYFIIIAASLLQYYPSTICCARLAFIDEAFSALSVERIEQMVKYLEENRFQVIYAAPPEKINSIGSHINSTVSLVKTGKFTNVVEGLIG